MTRSSIPFASILVAALLPVDLAISQDIDVIDLADNWTTTFAGYTATDGTVNALLPFNEGLVVAGSFNRAGGIPTKGIAFFDGADWSTFGAGVEFDEFFPGSVFALAEYDGDLYIAGRFKRVDGVSAEGIAKWDGTNWSPVGSGMPIFGIGTPIRALEVFDGRLCAGGSFQQAGGVSASRIACWDGADWAPLAGGADNTVWDLLADGTTLYAAGDFTSADGAGPYVASWDGSAWSSVGTVTNNPNRAVYSLALHDGKLVAGGRFSQLGSSGPSALGIAAWDGATWESMDADFSEDINPPTVTAVFSDGTTLFATGNQQVQDGFNFVQKIHLKQWDANTSAWILAGENPDQNVQSFAAFDGSVIIGGAFVSFGDMARAYYIARWQGGAWESVGEDLNNTVNGPINDVLVDGTDVWFGGEFTMAGGQPALRVVKWDGTTWAAPVGGPNGPVLALIQHGGDLCIGGAFSEVGGVPANNVACWDGSSWNPVDSGLKDQFEGESDVSSLEVFDGDLIAGGLFNWIAGAEADVSNVARWDGSAWHPMGTGLGTRIQAMAVQGTRLLAGGLAVIFSDGVAAWDGSQWGQLNSTPGLNAMAVNDLVVDGDNVFLAGQGAFDDGDGVRACLLARYDAVAETLHHVAGCILPGPLKAVDLAPEDLLASASRKTDNVVENAVLAGGLADEVNGAPLFGMFGVGQSVPIPFYRYPANTLEFDIEAIASTDFSTIAVGYRAPFAIEFSYTGTLEILNVAIDGPDWLGVGQVEFYDYIVSNPEESPAIGVTMTVPYADTVSWDDRCGANGFTNFCIFGDLEPGEADTVRLPEPPFASAPSSQLDLSATAQTDDGRRHGEAAKSVAILDLAVTVSGPEVLATGTPGEYVINIGSLNGFNEASVLHIETSTTTTLTVDKDGCTQTTSITCNIAALGERGSEAVPITVESSTDFSLQVRSETVDETVTGRAVVDVEVVDAPLVVTIMSPDTVEVGDLFDASITVTNPGPDVATAVTLYPGAYFKPVGCVQRFTYDYRCDLGDLAVGESRTIFGTIEKQIYHLDPLTISVGGRARTVDGQRNGAAEKYIAISRTFFEDFFRAFHGGFNVIQKRVSILDIYLKSLRLVDDLEPGFATPYLPINLPSIRTLIGIVDGDDPDNSAPLFSRDIDWRGAGSATSVLSPHNTLIVTKSVDSSTDFVFVKDDKLAADDPSSVDVRFAHAALESGPVDVRVAGGGAILVDDIAPGGTTGYQTLSAADVDLEITTPDGSEILNLGFETYELSGAAGMALTFVIVKDPPAAGKAASDTLSMLAIRADGSIMSAAQMTANDDDAGLPTQFVLNRNYPNPFHPTTTISYELPAPTDVSLTLLDLLGRRVQILESGNKSAGRHRVIFDASTVSSGIYFYRLEAGDFVDVKRMVVLK